MGRTVGASLIEAVPVANQRQVPGLILVAVAPVPFGDAVLSVVTIGSLLICAQHPKGRSGK